MRFKGLAVGGAGVSWGVCVADLLPVPVELTVQQQAFALSVALISSAWLLLCAHKRPIAAVYQLGYEHGQQDALAPVGDPEGCPVVPLRTSAMSPRHSAHPIDA